MGASGTRLQIHLRNLNILVHQLNGRSLSDTGGVDEVKKGFSIQIWIGT